MMKYFFMALLFLLTPMAFGEEALNIALEKAPTNIHDKESIQRGAVFFSRNCMMCHTMIYLRYDPLAIKTGVLYSRMPLNVKAWPLNVTPPDLSLEASRRGVDWIYTYLHSFYLDPSRPTGVNNLLFPNTAMPNSLAMYQGQQIKVSFEKAGVKLYSRDYQWYDLLELQTPGSMTSEQFDATITDVVNFLAYAAEPYQEAQENLGRWVIGFLIILFLLIYRLKREYWKQWKK